MTIRRTLLLSFLAVSLAPTAVLTFLAFIQARGALEKEIARNLFAQASTAMAQIDWMLFERMANVRAWSRLEALQEIRIDDIDKRVSHVLFDLKAGHEVYDHIFCTNLEGKIVAASDQRLLGQHVASRLVWLTMSFPGTVVSLEPFPASLPEQGARLTLQAPIADVFHPEELLGALYAVFDWDQIFLILDGIEQNSTTPEGGRRAVLLDQEGRIIAADSLLRQQKFLSSSVLASYFLEKHGKKLGFGLLGMSDAARARLQTYSWPGNVRELSNIIERAVVLSRGELIDIAHLPREIAAPATQAATLLPIVSPLELALPPAVEQLEQKLITQALQHVGGNKAKAARLLDISERALWYKVKKYRIS